MKTSRVAYQLLTTSVFLGASGAWPQTPPPSGGSSLGGTSWQLVRFEGSDDKTLTPDDKTKYTIAFGTDGSLIARIDCNRGRGTWKSSGPSQVELGPLALTRAMCPPGSLHNQIVKQWSAVRSYVIKDGHLFLSLMADGGIYEFEPVPGAKPAPPRSPVAFTGPFTFDCTQPGGGAETLTATFYKTEPAMVLVDRAGQARPAFGVRAASGSKYEGQDVMFWDARGEAAVTWSGTDLKCKRR